MDKEKYYTDKADFDKGKIKVKCFESSEEVFSALAKEMAEEIIKNNINDEKTVLIVPVGPVGQYPYFVSLINENNISLKNVYFINMDEYLNDEGDYIDSSFPHSFRSFMEKNVYSKIKKELLMSENQRIFPDPKDTKRISFLIKELGKVDIAFGGIGINGHLAFNEAEEVSAEEFSNRETRVINIAPETITANAIGDMDGALSLMPKKAVTIGMKEILSARKVRLGVFRTWHRAVLRRAIFDSPSGSFPVTLLQNHSDALIYSNDIASCIPER